MRALQGSVMFALSVVAGCNGDITTDTRSCPTSNTAPEQPSLVGPTSLRDIVPAQLLLAASPFVDADGDLAEGTEYELWNITSDGELLGRVWYAEVAGGGTAELVDGEFEPGFTALYDWTEYAVRTRHLDDAGCASEWSDPLLLNTDDGSKILFDPTVIRDLYITIPPASWDAIDAEAIPPGCVPHQRSYYTASMRFEGQQYDGIGIKVKGGCGSARQLDGKPGLKINLEWDDPSVAGCPEGRRIYGQKHFTLNNQVQDQSATHEQLGYRFYRAMGVPVPRSAPIRVHINDQLYGLYLDIETVDRRFLAHNFDDSSGMAYEGTYWCDLIPGNVPPDGDDSRCLTREFSPSTCSPQPADGDLQDYPLLRELVGQIDALPDGGFYPEVGQFFEYDRFLSMWAVESVISHWDAYTFSIMNNYRIYHDPSTGRWTMIPSGIDQTFSGDQDPWAVGGVLAGRCLEESDCKAAFAAKLQQATTVLTSLQLGLHAQSVHDQILDDVTSDPRKEYDMGTFEGRHDEIQQFVVDRPERIRQHLQAHGF